MNNTILWVIIAIVAIAIIITIIIVGKKRKQNEIVNIDSMDVEVINASENEIENIQPGEMAISFEKINSLTPKEKNNLVEIKDHKVIEHVQAAIPQLADAGIKVANAKKGQEVLFRVIIPKGEELVKAKNMKGAFRGFFRNKKGIKGQADLVPVKQGGKAIMNAGSAAMGAAAMVVGQYYMEEINKKLEEINKGINHISDFLDDDYKGKVQILFGEVQKSAQFKTEIMENEDVVQRELIKLDRLEEKCGDLLGHANNSIETIAKKEELDFDEYEKKVSEADKWFQYQNVLLQILYKICELKYAYNQGQLPIDYCYAISQPYEKQTHDALTKLSEWDKKYCVKYKVDLSEFRRERRGLEKIPYLPLRPFGKGKYKKIKTNTVEKIKMQQDCTKENVTNKGADLFNDDVQIIKKDEKFYYLPNAK